MADETAPLRLDPNVVSGWIARLRHFFPGLDRFDRPDPDFDASERNYKLETAQDLRAALEAASDDRRVAAAVHDVLARKKTLAGTKRSNLVSRRRLDPFSQETSADRAILWPALSALIAAADGDAGGHPAALQAFAEAWVQAVPQGKADQARQIGELLLMHLNPDAGVFMRSDVRRDLWKEALGNRFPTSGSMADIYAREVRFMQAVRRAFEDQGLAPRDMIDVQSALWVVHSYKDDAMDEQADNPAGEETTARKEATNLILYGPPGTGKTHETAWEAVKLCQGEAAAEALRGKERRKDLMAAYRQLEQEGRIAFVTFHQSLSYEEFVEGLRPETGAVQDAALAGEEPANGGFRLRVEDGVFKRFAGQARNDPGQGQQGDRLDRSRRVIRLGLPVSGWRETFDRAIREGQVDWPHGGDIDWSPPQYEQWEAIKQRRKQDDPSTLGNQPAVFGTWLMRAGAETGDYIFLTVGRNRIVAIGQLNGDYRFEPASQGAPARHLRPVAWLWSDPKGIARETICDADFTSFHPAYTIRDELLNWDGIEALVPAAQTQTAASDARPHVLIIDEINRANISKVFGELITLLEPDKRLGMENEIRVTLPYSKKSFGVPANLHIIGTMNTADRSIALLDTALRRRFRFRELMPKPELLPRDAGGVDLCKMLTRLNERIEYFFDREHQIGHAYFINCATRGDIDAVLRDAVIPLLAEYFYEDWSRIAAVLEGCAPPQDDFDGRFVKAERLRPPGVNADDEDGDVRLRWSVKPTFDFSEFSPA